MNVTLGRKAQAQADVWAARVEREGLTVGQRASVKRVLTDSRDYITAEWWEPATIVEIRTFDALVQFDSDGTKSSSGLGLVLAPCRCAPSVPRPTNR